jgi:hypothetical protein
MPKRVVNAVMCHVGALSLGWDARSARCPVSFRDFDLCSTAQLVQFGAHPEAESIPGALPSSGVLQLLARNLESAGPPAVQVSARLMTQWTRVASRRTTCTQRRRLRTSASEMDSSLGADARQPVHKQR